MIWRNTPERYGAVHKTLHWVIAILVLMMLVMGLVMGDISNPADRFWVYSLHKSIGITVLALMVVRLGWKLLNHDLPKPLPTHPRHERIAAAAVHWGFYALLIAMPLSGWILTSAASSTINWFGQFVVPPIVDPNQDLREVMSDAHEIIAYAIWAFIALHVAGALKHLIIDRDRTVARMLPFGALLLMLPAALTLAIALPGTARAQDKDAPPSWTIQRDQSALTFEGTQEGGAFKGRFNAFDGTILFDPANPQTGSATINIDLGSVDSQNAERDASVKDKDWFDIATTPTATYKIEKFEKSGKGEGDFLAIGKLTLRGIERPLDLPFTLSVEEKDGVKTAHAVGRTSLKRLDFGVGGGQWADEAMVGDSFAVQVDLVATGGK